MLVLLIVFCKSDKLTLLNTKLINTLIKINYSLSTFRRCQDSRERGLTLTLYKKPFRYRLPVSPPRKRTKTSSSTPNLKSPSIRTPSLFKKSLSISKYLYPFKRISTSIRRNLFTKDDETSPQIYTSYNIT